MLDEGYETNSELNNDLSALCRILSPISIILLLKKFIKSLLVRAVGMQGSIEWRL